jgi:hypothetical protein
MLSFSLQFMVIARFQANAAHQNGKQKRSLLIVITEFYVCRISTPCRLSSVISSVFVVCDIIF